MAKKQKKAARKSKTNRAIGVSLKAADVISFNEFFAMCLASGLSPAQCLDYCAKSCESPLREALERSVNEVRLGSSLQEALVLLGNTVRSHHFGMSVRAIILALGTGASPLLFLRTQNEILIRFAVGERLPEAVYQDIPTTSSL